MGPGPTDLKAETDGKSLVAAMTARAAAAKKVCARRRPRPAGVPGAPGGSFIRTPRGCVTPSPSACSCACACAGVGGAGGGASTGCIAGRLARITPGSAPPVSGAPASGSRQARERTRRRGRDLGGDSKGKEDEEHEHSSVVRPLSLCLSLYTFFLWGSGLFTWSLWTGGAWVRHWSGWWRVLLSAGFLPRGSFREWRRVDDSLLGVING